MTPPELAQLILQSFGDEFIPKFEKGQVEHGGNLLDKPGAIKQAKNENMDNTSYLFVIHHQVQSVLEYLLQGDTESCKLLLERLLADPTE